MAKSRDPGLDNNLFSFYRSSSCSEQQVAIFPVDGAPELFFRMLGLFGPSFKRTYVLSLQEVKKFCRIWNTLMQVWMTGYRGFLLETIGLFVDEAELYFLFRQQIAIFRVEALS